METRFAGLIWAHAPISSGELVKLCQQELSWKKSTTYTMLRRLCQRGNFQNSSGVVTALLSKEEFQGCRAGSLWRRPLRAPCQIPHRFFQGREVVRPEIDELQKLIDEMRV